MPQGDKGDRREKKRFPVAGCLATMSREGFLASIGLGPKCVGEVLDLNPKGARVRLSERVSLFEVYRIRLQQLQGEEKVGGIKARTVWEKCDGAPGKYQVGLHFLTNGSTTTGIQEMLKRCRTKAPPV
ncbi:MAG: PilZ domain-containing protein [Planctomycetota bacterium]